MKAKEYADRIVKDWHQPRSVLDKTIVAVMQELMHEVVTITEERHCSTDSAYIAVMDEIDYKWQAICRIVNNQLNVNFLLKDGFRRLAVHQADKANIPLLMVWHPKKISR